MAGDSLLSMKHTKHMVGMNCDNKSFVTDSCALCTQSCAGTLHTNYWVDKSGWHPKLVHVASMINNVALRHVRHVYFEYNRRFTQID